MGKNSEREVSCKIGTIPALVRVWGKSQPTVGKKLKIKERGSREWKYVYVDRVNPDGYFFASR